LGNHISGSGIKRRIKMVEVKEPIETKNQINTKIHVKFADDHYCLKMGWEARRMASLEIRAYKFTEFYVEVTLEDIEKIVYDLLKIIEMERKQEG